MSNADKDQSGSDNMSARPNTKKSKERICKILPAVKESRNEVLFTYLQLQLVKIRWYSWTGALILRPSQAQGWKVTSREREKKGAVTKGIYQSN